MNSEIRTAAAHYWQWGANVTAIKSTGTHPYKNTTHRWKPYQSRRQTKAEAAGLGWNRKDLSGCGIICGFAGWRCIDVDDCTELLVVLKILDGLRIPHSYRWIVKSGSGKGWHVWFRCYGSLPPDLLAKKKGEPGVRTGLPKGKLKFDHLELRWKRCQTITPPSLHPSGGQYEFYNGVPEEPPLEVPVERVVEAIESVARPPEAGAGTGRARQASPRQNGQAKEATAGEATPNGEADEGLALRIVGRAIERARTTHERNSEGLWLACQLRDNNFSSDDALRYGRQYVGAVKADKPGEDPYTFDEYESSVEQAYSRPAREPWSRSRDARSNGQAGGSKGLSSGDSERDDRTHSQILVDLADDFELFHTPNDQLFASFKEDGRLHTARIRSSTTTNCMRRRFFVEKQKPPSAQALQDAKNELAARAQFDGEEREVHVRVAGHNGRIYIDLADERGNVVEIDARGWRIVKAENAPVRFRRPKGMKALPEPVRGGSLDKLRKHVRVKGDDEFALLLGYLVQALSPTGEYPVGVFVGEQGSGKTTVSRLLRALIDPSRVPTSTLPRNERDLAISAEHSWLLVYNNLSGLSARMSDAFCRLSDGSGLRVRTHYENREEELFFAERPLLLNGIEDLTTRGDLARRALVIRLEPIPQGERKKRSALWEAFKRDTPEIIGALYDAVSAALASEKPTPEGLPSMAEFADWANRAEAAFPVEEGTFLQAYRANQGQQSRRAVENHPVAAAICDLLEDGARDEPGEWTGRMAELLDDLKPYLPNPERPPKNFPDTFQGLTAELRRLMPALRAEGVRRVDNLGKKGRAFRLYLASDDDSAGSAGSGHNSNRHRSGDEGADHPKSKTWNTQVAGKTGPLEYSPQPAEQRSNRASAPLDGSAGASAAPEGSGRQRNENTASRPPGGDSSGVPPVPAVEGDNLTVPGTQRGHQQAYSGAPDVPAPRTLEGSAGLDPDSLAEGQIVFCLEKKKRCRIKSIRGAVIIAEAVGSGGKLLGSTWTTTPDKLRLPTLATDD